MKVVRTILFILNVLLALGLVAATLGDLLPPSRSVLPSLAAYAYLPLLAANVLMIVLWLLLRRWTWLFSAAVIALRWSTLGFFFQVGGTAKAPAAEEHPYAVSLMTYNVHQFQGVENRPGQSDSNAVEFLALVRRHQPDVLCLQEFAAPKTLALTDSLTLMGYNHYYGVHTSRNGTPYGTVVFSRLPITYVTCLDSEKLLVELHKEGQRFRVCCVHMDSYRFDASDREEIERMRHGEVQQSSRRMLGKVKETILSHEEEWTQRIKPVVTGSSLPMVLAGDLNDIPGSWLYRQIADVMEDSFCEKGRGMSITYNGGFPEFRIDMVFHGEGINTLGYKRIKTDMSDHYPVLTYLELAI
ncbi:MAG: endonuclease/exonuclease/phosphatase family protein [Bacteroidales bacterium]|nr:endonuclease/exonuclease/phosphatase family protein [Bacteroidales bacterium]